VVGFSFLILLLMLLLICCFFLDIEIVALLANQLVGEMHGGSGAYLFAETSFKGCLASLPLFIYFYALF
jgi:hypothetical protein